ncbi:MAG: hypothetical protein ACMXYC_00990 [Candidatus Woesearchaeota archaeon]
MNELEERINQGPIVSKGIEVLDLTNLGFWPSKNLQKGLQKVVTFPEVSSRKLIPNGSLWMYEPDTPYNPDILRDDVGCGITTYLCEKIPDITEVAQLLSDTQIGRGNHFVDICHFDNEYDLIALHSDLNEEKKHPQTFKEAKNRMNEARYRRGIVIESILERLEIKGSLWKDWTHNFVDVHEDRIVYGKGVVDTKKHNGFGLMGLNPTQGLLLFRQSANNDIDGYMQHGLGRIPEKRIGNYFIPLNKKCCYLIPPEELQRLQNREDKVQVISINDITSLALREKMNNGIDSIEALRKGIETYQDVENVFRQHGRYFTPLRILTPRLVIQSR